MDLNDIRQLVELMDEHGLSHFRLEKEEFELELKKGTDIEAAKDLLAAMPTVSAAPAVAAPLAAAPVAVAPAAGEAPAAAPVGEALTSPMVGTFYSKPAPDADIFVKAGDKVEEGQVICIIEAMKVMNEIKAEKAGTISEICVEDGTPVQFGDDLFRLS